MVLWDKPALSPHITGLDKSAICPDWRTERRSAYNYAQAEEAYARMVTTLNARFILTSYSTDGNITLRNLLCAASRRGAISAVFNPYKRYRVSAQRLVHSNPRYVTNRLCP